MKSINIATNEFLKEIGICKDSEWTQKLNYALEPILKNELTRALVNLHNLGNVLLNCDAVSQEIEYISDKAHHRAPVSYFAKYNWCPICDKPLGSDEYNCPVHGDVRHALPMYFLSGVCKNPDRDLALNNPIEKASIIQFAIAGGRNIEDWGENTLYGLYTTPTTLLSPHKVIDISDMTYSMIFNPKWRWDICDVDEQVTFCRIVGECVMQDKAYDFKIKYYDEDTDWREKSAEESDILDVRKNWKEYKMDSANL